MEFTYTKLLSNYSSVFAAFVLQEVSNFAQIFGREASIAKPGGVAAVNS